MDPEKWCRSIRNTAGKFLICDINAVIWCTLTPEAVLWIRFRKRIKVISWIRSSLQIRSLNLCNMSRIRISVMRIHYPQHGRGVYRCVRNLWPVSSICMGFMRNRIQGAKPMRIRILVRLWSHSKVKFLHEKTTLSCLKKHTYEVTVV